ncbi:MAG: M48 family metallopeptidase [Bacteroidia bacterium]|nr:M48 family metallopeptidase [Bacteroidia bacterium]
MKPYFSKSVSGLSFKKNRCPVIQNSMRPTNLCLLLIAFFLFYQCALSQVPTTFIPSKLVVKDSVAQVRIDKTYNQSIALIQNEEKYIKDYLKDIYTERKEYLKSAISGGEFLFDSFLQTYAQNVLDHILSKNPVLRKDMLLLVSRNPMVNAYSLGDGIIIIYSGLLERLDNEAQLAFILCHELAHDHKNHNSAKAIGNAKKYLDPEFQKKLKEVLQEQYMVKQKLTDLVKPGVLEDMRYSRDYEIEADTIGMRFFLNTDYAPAAALEIMEILDNADKESDLSPIDIKEVFSSPSVPFRNGWTYYEPGSSLGVFEEEERTADEDSLKTHPDTKIRAEKIQLVIPPNAKSGGQFFRQPETQFAHMKMASEGEIVELYLATGNVGRAIFLATQMQKHWPHDTIYSNVTMAHAFAMLSNYQEKTSANKVMPLPSHFYDENYNRIISFLWELKKSETAGIAEVFLNRVPSSMTEHEHVLSAFVYQAYISKQKESFIKYQTEFLKNFSKGKYNWQIRNLNLN